MTIQPQNNNLNYLIGPIICLSFSRSDTRDYRNSFSHYYVLDAKINDFNVLIDGKRFFDLPVKNEEESYEKIIEISNNNDYTTGNLLNFA